MQLRGKTALITGSAKGLGKMTALALANEGCHIAINYLHSYQEADRLAVAVRRMGVQALLIQADITKRNDLARMMEQTVAWQGGVDILINNAGPFVRERRRFADYKEEDIETLLHGNLLSAMLLDHMAIPFMREKRWGRIIHYGFGSASESRGWPHRAVYAAAKVGLVSFTKTLAIEEAEFGITVNMICPGDIRGANKEKTIAQVEGVVDEESPRGRPGTGEDIARVITHLCHPDSDFITGSIIEISGGLDPIRSLPLK